MELKFDYNHGKGHMNINLNKFYDGVSVTRAKKLMKLVKEHCDDETQQMVANWLQKELDKKTSPYQRSLEILGRRI